MKIAVIDLGTNTFHLVIAEIQKQDYKIIYKERAIVKIGQDSFQKGILTPVAYKKTLAVMLKFKQAIEQHSVDYIRAIGTSTLRAVSNSQEIIQEIRNKTSIHVNVISGAEEAKLVYQGIQQGLKIEQKKALIMDIGGGSIEFIIGNHEKALWKQSFEIGIQRLKDKFHHYDPILSEEVCALEDYLKNELKPLFKTSLLYQPNKLIGSSGSFKTIIEIYRQSHQQRHNTNTIFSLPINEFENIYDKVLHQTFQERLQIPGLSVDRVEMIVVACIVIQVVIKQLSIANIEFSPYSLKIGLLLNTMEALNASKTV